MVDTAIRSGDAAGGKGVFVLYGPPGGGKSKEAAECFQDALVLSSARNNLQFYKQWLRLPEGVASGCRLPKREIVLARSMTLDSWHCTANGRPIPQVQLQNGIPVPMLTISRFLQLVEGFYLKLLAEIAAGKPPTYRNLIIDEGGAFWIRIFREILPGVLDKNNEVDTRGAYNVMANWSDDVFDRFDDIADTGVANVCFITHEGDPEPEKGKKGGPKVVSKGIMGRLCQRCDGVIMREVKDRKKIATGNINDLNSAPVAVESLGPRRIWTVHLSENWYSKLRGVPDSMFEEVKDKKLRDVLGLGGFVP